MKTANEELKNYARSKKVFMWMIADAEGVGEFTIIRRLRHQLSKEETDRLMKLIDKIAESRVDE